MKMTKLVFDSKEMARMAALIEEIASDLRRRSVDFDDAKREALVKHVLEVASIGISDPNEIRALVLERYKL
jgi:hypothetical protein